MIDRERFSRMLEESARLMLEEADALSEIDSKFGDADHGLTMAKIAKVIQQQVAAWDEGQPLKDFLEDLGMDVMAVRGGSAGPLYGTLVGGLGVELADNETVVTGDAARRMFAGCLSELRDITTAQVGDKTMMDAVVPAVEAAQACASDDPADVFAAAADAAEAGAAASEQFASKFGRARSYGEQTIGTPDAGAVSTSLFLRGLAQGAAH